MGREQWAESSGWRAVGSAEARPGTLREFRYVGVGAGGGRIFGNLKSPRGPASLPARGAVGSGFEINGLKKDRTIACDLL